MIKVEVLEALNDFLKLRVGDKIVIKYMNGKMFFLELTKVDNLQLVGKPDINYLQETSIDIKSLVNRDIGKYIDSVIKLT